MRGVDGHVTQPGPDCYLCQLGREKMDSRRMANCVGLTCLQIIDARLAASFA